MRGGAQSHLMRCSDGHFYVVKFANNPQHVRVLANEFFASRLAQQIGLPVPGTEIIEVGQWLIENTSELRVHLAHGSIPCRPGLQCGSRYAVDPARGQVFDHLPVEILVRTRNLAEFAGILAFDKWTGNTDNRQAAFWKLKPERRYNAAFIDQGNCFNAGSWTFPDDPTKGVYRCNEVYEGIRGWSSFEPWLSRIEALREHVVWKLANEIPSEWWGSARHELETMVSELIARRHKIRALIESLRQSQSRSFPLWNDGINQEAKRAIAS